MRQARVLLRSRVALVSLALVVAGVVVCYRLAPHYALAERVQQLQMLNGRLQDEISRLERRSSSQGGGSAGEDLGGGPENCTHLYNHVLENCEAYSVSRCETIHIAFVAAGYNASHQVVTVIKSILFYRHNPLHFHFLSDALAKHILETLMETWQLPAVNFSFYDTEPLKQRVSWIPNIHYSGVYGLVKLVVHEAFPSNISSIIMLDTDLLFNTDVAYLWRYFIIIKHQKKLLGIVENQSDWYLGTLWENHRPWPAIGRGFNTGMTLLNLEEMRRQNWTDMWLAITREHFGPVSLADQDIVNAVIKQHPYIHLVLPCTWNVQLCDRPLSQFCYQDTEIFHIIHWNSPKRVDVENKHSAYFKQLYNGFVQYNGNLLRRELIACQSFKPDTPSTDNQSYDACIKFRTVAKLKHRTHPFFLSTSPQSHVNATNQVTLISQLSMDRLQMLEPLCHHWKGPMSVAVYASDAEAVKLFNYVTSQKCFQERSNIAMHVVYVESPFYPVNYLRNVALDHLTTKYAFLLDIDFLPMPDLHQYLLEATRVLGAEKRALVIPAFETHLYRLDLPHRKPDLLEMVEAGHINPFRHREWPQGHQPTNYEHWKTASRPYRVSWAPDFEPYVVLQWPFPHYDTRFVGFGWNKVSHIMELHHAGYEFVVLPEPYVIHLPHSPSLDITNFRSSSLYRDCLQVLKREFKDMLQSKY